MKYSQLIFTVFILSTKWASAELLYFNSYEENKKAFTELAASHLRTSWSLKNHSDLTTDLALYSYDSDELLVFSSGLHGIEGFVGSSLQRALMDQIKDRKKLKSDILFVHALNPWGMKNKRRVNENNVDLNRNFSIQPDLYAQKNEDYLKINSFLNPDSPLSLGILHRLGFITHSIQLILSYSIETLRKSILIGQYFEPKGLYFGGRDKDDLQLNIDILFQKNLSHYKNITWIDLHTGYGERAKMHLLANDSQSESGKSIQKLFPKHPIDFGDQKNFYKTTGDLVSYLISKSTAQQQIHGVTFEYGSMDSQKTLGSIESLRRMVIENQGFHHGYVDDNTKTTAQKLFEDMFFPQESDWKEKVEKQTWDVLSPLLAEVHP